MILHEIFSVNYEPLSSNPKPMTYRDVFTPANIVEIRKTILNSHLTEMRRKYGRGIGCEILFWQTNLSILLHCSKSCGTDILKEL